MPHTGGADQAVLSWTNVEFARDQGQRNVGHANHITLENLPAAASIHIERCMEVMGLDCSLVPSGHIGKSSI
jgi:hypothetical protein